MTDGATDGTEEVRPATAPVVARLHRAALVEDRVHAVLDRRLRRRGWRTAVVPFTGYGAPGWVRVMARVVLSRPGPRRRRRLASVRGWRSFLALPVKNTPVTIEVAGRKHQVRTDRGGYVDCVVDGALSPGWATVRLSLDAIEPGTEPVAAMVRIVDPAVRFGIVSDIDDTVMVTMLPRLMLAAWHTFVLNEHARMAVPGMAVLYERLTNANPGAPVLYLSTGAWNVAPALTRFLARHLYPAGPLLLTDWGPTDERWFRSGRAHKQAALVRLAEEFPHVKWLLIGDDGQHDREIYAQFAATHPDHVFAIAIRQLSATQTVLAGSLPTPHDAAESVDPQGHKWLSAPDGAGLWRLLHEADLV